MTYNLSNEYQRRQFSDKVSFLIGKGAAVELAEKTSRTHSQNAYLHLLIGVVAMETGNTLADAKEHYFKRLVNADLFCDDVTDRMGRTIPHLRSSADLTKEEMATAIDRFIRWGAENGIYLPQPGDKEILKAIEVELGRYKNML